MFKSAVKWTNESVKRLSGEDNPIIVIQNLVQETVLDAKDCGLSGPPYDPFKIAKYMGIKLVPRHDIEDARTIPVSDRKFVIEYNPNKSKARIKFSLAHELTHTLFPDCAKFIRNRSKKKSTIKDNWQLEMLCNIGASEMLMPVGSFPSLGREEINIGNLIELRKKFGVSSESLFLRVVKLTKVPCFVFVATKISPDEKNYAFDYIIPSRSWGLELPNNIKIPRESEIKQCTALGYKVIADEIWDEKLGKFHIECLGIPPFPTHRYPRILGIVTKSRIKAKKVNSIIYKTGDASHPKTNKPFIIAHIVNDKAQRWGGRGFAQQLKKKWPYIEKDYIAWQKNNFKDFKLGKIHKKAINDKSYVISMIAQRGYGPSNNPRIRYKALKNCLKLVAEEAINHTASIHMPRIGSGQARGSWELISELIEKELCDIGIRVYVYSLPPTENMKLFDL